MHTSFLVEDDIEKGRPVKIGEGRVYIRESKVGDEVEGVAAKRLVKHATVKYDPGFDTEDILTRSSMEDR